MNKKMLVTIVLLISVLGIAIAQQSKQSLTIADFNIEVLETRTAANSLNAEALREVGLLPDECRTDRSIEILNTKLAAHTCWKQDKNSGMYILAGDTDIFVESFQCTRKRSEKIINLSIAYYKNYSVHNPDGCLFPGNYK